MNIAELLKLYGTITRRFRPDVESIGPLEEYLRRTRGVDFYTLEDPYKMTAKSRNGANFTRDAIRDMIKSSEAVPLVGADKSQLLVLPSGEDLRIAGAAVNFSPKKYDDRSTYIETLGSRVPLGGLSLMRHIKGEAKGKKLALHSLPDEDTMRFYEKLGFKIAPDPHSSALPYYELPGDSPMRGDAYGLPDKRKAGGAVVSPLTRCSPHV